MCVSVRFRFEKGFSQNNRFRIDEQIRTNAIFFVPDDVTLRQPERQLKQFLDMWQKYPEKLIGK